MWGYGVLGGAGFEVCTVAANCQRGVQGTGDGQRQFPTDISINAAGKVVVADRGNGRVQAFEPAGAWIVKSASFGFISGPTGITATGAGNLYVSDGSVDFRSSGDRVVVLNDTTLVQSAEITPTAGGNGEFRKPIAIASDPAGNLFVL
ncbi:MAG: hypothetical protein WBD34_22220, partial [Burkholderiaceae bacterium]